MNLTELLDAHPLLHLDADGGAISWAIGDEVLRYLAEVTGPGTVTMETGAGMSTVVLALAGARHTAIAPSAHEFDQIRRFCSQHSISLADTELVEERSERALPRITGGRQLDLFLIDGRHAFPTPFLDWFYGSELLKVGGLMMVDDTQLTTGATLVDFMAEDDHWEEVHQFGKTAVFRLLDESCNLVEWNQQPWITARMDGR